MPVFNRLIKQKNKKSARDVNNEEIQALLSKLKEIVPNMPRNRKLSKLEIIQYVIDYIVDLQIALECHHPPQHRISPRTTSPPHRQPLGIITSPSNSTAAQEVNPLERHRSGVVLKSSSRSMSS